MKVNSKGGEGAKLINLVEVEDDYWDDVPVKSKLAEVRPQLPKLNLKAPQGLRLPGLDVADASSDVGGEPTPVSGRLDAPVSGRASNALQLDLSHDGQDSASEMSDDGLQGAQKAPMMRRGNYTPRVGLSVQDRTRRTSFRKVSQRDLLEQDVGFTKYFTKVINQEDSKFYTPRDSKRFFALPLPK